MKIKYNPLLSNLAAFRAMSDGARRAAGRQARQDAADAGYANPDGHITIRHADGRKSRIALFSA